MDGMILLDVLKDKKQLGCLGQGRCGKCRVRLVDGPSVEPSPIDRRHLSPSQLKRGWILACQHRYVQGMVIEEPSLAERKKQEKILADGRFDMPFQASVTKMAVNLTPPTPEDRRPDLERVLTFLGVEKQNVSRSLLASLPGILRENNFEVTVVMLEEQLSELEALGEQLIAVEPGDTTAYKYGVVIDFGTDTIAGWLADLNTGELLAVSSLMNPQEKYGTDVLTRVSHVASLDGLAQLRASGLDACNEIVCRLLNDTGINYQQIYETVIVGNTVMTHLLLGIDPSHLGNTPYIPAVGSAMSLTAEDFGLDVLATSKIFFLPNIAGFTGSDAVGFMVDAGFDCQDKVCLGIDIGTNTEVILLAGENILACSAPTGPAFAGYKIKCGMGIGAGAIDKVEITGDEVNVHVVDEVGPRGIAAAGLLAAVAALLKLGVIDLSGKFVPQNSSHELRMRLHEGDDGLEFVLVSEDESVTGDDIVITQQDVREVQMIKSTIRAAINILLGVMSITAESVDKVIVTGSFGMVLAEEDIAAIGLVPDSCRDKIAFIHNAAGSGARRVLLSQSARQRALALAGKTKHIEISTHPDFRMEFIKSMQFS